MSLTHGSPNDPHLVLPPVIFFYFLHFFLFFFPFFFCCDLTARVQNLRPPDTKGKATSSSTSAAAHPMRLFATGL